MRCSKKKATVVHYMFMVLAVPSLNPCMMRQPKALQVMDSVNMGLPVYRPCISAHEITSQTKGCLIGMVSNGCCPALFFQTEGCTAVCSSE